MFDFVFVSVKIWLLFVFCFGFYVSYERIVLFDFLRGLMVSSFENVYFVFHKLMRMAKMATENRRSDF